MKKFYKEDNESIPAIKYADTQPVGFTEITDEDEISLLYLKQNKKLKADGIDYVAVLKIDNFGVPYRDGTLTDANVNYLYNKLPQLIMRLEDGNWESAKYLLENELNTISQNDIDNGYTQAVHDGILNDITTYINNI